MALSAVQIFSGYLPWAECAPIPGNYRSVQVEFNLGADSRGVILIGSCVLFPPGQDMCFWVAL